MTRVSVDAIDLYLIESGTALNLWASPIRLATCNLHGNHVKSGVTAVLPAVRLRQLICAGQQQVGQTHVLDYFPFENVRPAARPLSVTRADF